MNDAARRLLEAIGAERLVLLADVVCRIQALAVERRTDQSITLRFNESGYLRVIEASDNVRMRDHQA